MEAFRQQSPGGMHYNSLVTKFFGSLYLWDSRFELRLAVYRKVWELELKDLQNQVLACR